MTVETPGVRGGFVDGFVTLPSEPGRRKSIDPNLDRWFSKTASFSEGSTVAKMIAEMDEADVRRGVLHARPAGTLIPPGPYGVSQRVGDDEFDASCEQLAEVLLAHPGRFVGCVPIDPTSGMTAVRQLTRAYTEFGVRSCWIMPALIGLPANHGCYFPIYMKCVELGIPIKINVGVPGPMRLGRLQEVMAIDEVLLAFPELRIVAAHLGHPWQAEVISLLAKHEHLFLMTSGWAPRHVPQEVWEFANRRGAHKLLWASDYPLLSFARCADEAAGLPLSPEALQGYASENALRVFGFEQA